MFRNKVIFCIITLFCILNAASNLDDDDVLLLSQISASGKCCVTPLVSQKGGASHGPAAQWVDAKYYLSDGEKAHLFTGTINWDLRHGGSVTLPESSEIDWKCLQIRPTLDEQTLTTLGMVEGEFLSFKLKTIKRTGNSLTISPYAIMVRKSGDTIIRKKMMMKYVVSLEFTQPSSMASNFHTSKGILSIKLLRTY